MIKIKEIHYDVNWRHFIEDSEWRISIQSKYWHEKLEFRKSKIEILKAFKEAIEEFINK